MARIKTKTVISSSPSFQEVKKWYMENLHPDVNEYNDPEVYKYVYHEARWAGIFQCTSDGAQKFFVKAKPESITDIAALTSIYRPGPLSAHVDKIYMKAKRGEKFEWGHPLFEQVLGDTYNCLIFQESVMDLAEHVGGFPKDQCDNIRRAIMKRDHSKGEAAQAEVKRMEDDFIRGAMSKGVSESIAKKAYETIGWMSGYGFNRAHATAYAIDSFMCAFLMFHHETQWLTAYLESMDGNDAARAKAFSEVRAMGYDIVPIDIKFATKSWTVLPGKKLMPALTSAKGVGDTAADELESMRPFETLEELLWNDDGSWRLKKFNKKALEALIDVEAFNSLDCVGEGKLFKHYKQMYHVLIECGNDIKKSSKKDPFIGKKRFYELLRETEMLEPYTKIERITRGVEHFGTVDVNMIISETTKTKLTEKGIKSIDEHAGVGTEDLYWFCLLEVTIKKSRNDKQYLIMKVVGPAGTTHKINAWAYSGKRTFEPYSIIISNVTNDDDYGFATMAFKMNVLNVE